MRWIFIGIILLNGLTGRSQLISLENSSGYIGKTVTVYGKVTAANFNETRRRDTCTLTLLDEASGQSLLVKILPETRAGFGYRPEQALLNKLAYFSGNLQMNKGVTEMYLNSPFSISFKQGEAINEPQDQLLPPQPKPQASAKNSETTTRTTTRPIQETGPPATSQERIKQPKADHQKVANKAKQADETSIVVAEQSVARQPDVPAEKPAHKTKKRAGIIEEKTRNLEAPKNTATPNPYNGTAPNPNPLSAAPAVQNDPLVGTELILRSKISLRGGPGGFFTTTGSIDKGERVKILSCSFDWCKVIQVNDKIIRLDQGYVKATRLKQ